MITLKIPGMLVAAMRKFVATIIRVVYFISYITLQLLTLCVPYHKTRTLSTV
jgi:hypothetical protein